MAIVREGKDFTKIRDSRGVNRYKDNLTGQFVNKELARFTRDKSNKRWIDLNTGRFVSRDKTTGHYQSKGKNILSDEDYAKLTDMRVQRKARYKQLKKFEYTDGYNRAEALRQLKQWERDIEKMGISYTDGYGL